VLFVAGTSVHMAPVCILKNILNHEKSLVCGSDMFSFRILAPVA